MAELSLPDLRELTDGPTVRLATRAHRVFVGGCALAFAAFFLWASVCELDRVTRGAGKIVARDKNSVVQHFEGGIVTDILVAEGDRVTAHQPLLRLENSFSNAELNAARLTLAANTLKEIRLEAEATEATTVTFPDTEGFGLPQSAVLLRQEAQLFDARRRAHEKALSILEEQIAQKKSAVVEREARLANRDREYDLLAERVRNLQALAKEGVVPRNEVLQNKAALQALDADRSDLRFQIDEAKSALEEVEYRRHAERLGIQQQAEEELVEVRAEIARAREEIAALTDRAQRFEVIAPIAGRINSLSVSTVGGVVRPGQTLAEIVPDTEAIEVEARLSPRDRAKVWPGLETVVRVSAYDFTTFGTIDGKVVEVSPDALQDDDGTTYFRVVVEADASAFGPDNPVVPGMLAEVDILSGRQTILDALLRPVRAVGARALRE